MNRGIKNLKKIKIIEEIKLNEILIRSKRYVEKINV